MSVPPNASNPSGAPPPAMPSFCDSDAACVFAKALLARAATCTLVSRRDVAERSLLECPSPVARTNCGTLAALLHERARFALRLPLPGRPLTHMQALRLQCGGLQALQQQLDATGTDVHSLVGLSHSHFGSLTDLPWATLVPALVAWQPRKRSSAAPQ